MLKAVLNCLVSHTDRKFGNHATYFKKEEDKKCIQYFTYHNNLICVVNWTDQKVWLDNAGWNTSSTNRALNDYKRYFEENHPLFEITDNRTK